MVSHDEWIVQTRSGPVSGLRLLAESEKPVHAFLGVPYARPPVGNLRFEKPQPVAPWSDVFKATKFPDCCPQKELAFRDDQEPSISHTEDMLKINVFTPSWEPKESAGFPVLVWIHGGGFVFGGAFQYGDVGIAENLVSKDVVVVVVQYRIGYYGFWSTGDSACPGNLGLWDQTAALRWVQENIGAFHGDKDNVTIFGQSAGGASVDYLLLSPHSNGLFHKAIPIAGSAYCPWAKSSSVVENCRKKARELGIDDDCSSEEMLNRLREVPWSDLVVEFNFTGIIEVSPVLDGDFLTGASIHELRREAPAKPIMTGFTPLEGAIFAIGVEPSEERIRYHIQSTLPQNAPLSAVDAIYSEYHAKSDDPSSMQRTLLEATGDHLFNVPVDRFVRDTLGRNPSELAPLFRFRFDYYNPASIGELGKMLSIEEATHASELSYLFGKSLFAHHDLNDEDRKIAHLFTTLVTNFAKHGNPNGPSHSASELAVPWTPTDSSNPEYHYVIDRQPRMEEGFFNGRLAKYAGVWEK